MCAHTHVRTNTATYTDNTRASSPCCFEITIRVRGWNEIWYSRVWFIHREQCGRVISANKPTDLIVIWGQNLSPVFVCLILWWLYVAMRGELPCCHVKHSVPSVKILGGLFSFFFFNSISATDIESFLICLFFFSGWTTSSSAKKSQGWSRSCRSLFQFQVSGNSSLCIQHVSHCL